MIIKENKNVNRQARHKRVTKKVFGTSISPRLNVYRSSSYIYAQIINDIEGKTLCSCSSFVMKKELEGKNKVEQAREVGMAIGKKATEMGVSQVVFDRGGYIYIGRVQALAEGARKAGLKF